MGNIFYEHLFPLERFLKFLIIHNFLFCKAKTITFLKDTLSAESIERVTVTGYVLFPYFSRNKHKFEKISSNIQLTALLYM